jgi:hypothetical protein
MKYEYYLYTWGGFYNEWNKHGEKPGHHYFDTAKERQVYIDKLQDIEKKLDARHLAMRLHEGFNCRTSTKLHRVIEVDGKTYYSENDLGVGVDFEGATYILEYKWRPGFNDEPLGGDFDYDSHKVKIIQEWISGCFTFKENEL